MPPNFSTFAENDDDAAERAARFATHDPFPSVPCALLSSAEVHDYARVTGMLHPFFPDALKSASYEAHIGGKFIRWDEHNCKHEHDIVRGSPCILPPNSITFIQVEPKFRLPNYIAIRFNLRITHVHRGLLLGTGPLVDPGFEGKLLIPLHNLTASEYSLDTNDALIWIEFTKTTFDLRPVESLASPPPRPFVPFPPAKKNLTADQYLRKANAGNPIRSSIPDAILRGTQHAERSAVSAADAKAAVTHLRNWLTGIGLVALAGLGVALYAIYLQVAGMVQNSIGLSTSVQQSFAPLSAEAESTAHRLTATQSDVDQLKRQLDQLTSELRAIKQQRPAVPRPRNLPKR